MIHQPLLSILIPTIPERDLLYNRLMNCIWNQTRKLDNMIVEVQCYIDRKEMTIGEKREKLYQIASGLYSWQIDDDDLISDNAIQLILEAIKRVPDVDCITFEEHIDIDGKIEKSNHSLIYDDWHTGNGAMLWDGFHYHRTPFFKSVIKTEIAKSIPIPKIRFGEDHQFAQLLKPHLHSEIHIPEQLYKYIHISSNFNERYGIPNI